MGWKRAAFIVAEERDDGVLIRPAEIIAVEIYTPERRAEFLLNNAVDAKDYRRALREVRSMGIDPASIRSAFRQEHHRR